VKVVKEVISTGGLFTSIPVAATGKGYLSPEQFHAAVSAKDPDTVLLDVRNHKEFMIGHFDGAEDPRTRTFNEWPAYANRIASQLSGKHVLMYCTGGIRCEKASAYLRERLAQEPGAVSEPQVSHLRGGIHKYLEAYPDGGHFKGKNFVFDRRGAVAAAESEGAEDSEEAAAGRKAAVVGACFSCSAAFDRLPGDAVCTVCREPVLVCDACRKVLAEFHCEAHQELAKCYFTNLCAFSGAELQLQLADLEARAAQVAVGRGFRNIRRMLRRQMDRVQERLQLLALGSDGGRQEGVGEGERSVTGGAVVTCRSCGDASCSGACWGFHGTGRLSTLDPQATGASMNPEPQTVPADAAALEGEQGRAQPGRDGESSEAMVEMRYDMSNLEESLGLERATAVLRDLARAQGLQLDEASKTLRGPPGVGPGSSAVLAIRTRGVLVWTERAGGPRSLNEARRLRRAAEKRDPEYRAACRDRRKAARELQRQAGAVACVVGAGAGGDGGAPTATSSGMGEGIAQALAPLVEMAAVACIVQVPGSRLALRLVAPYVHVYRCAAKARWVGRPLLEMLESEFGAQPDGYYAAAVAAGLVSVESSPERCASDRRIKAADIMTHTTLRHEPPVWVAPGWSGVALTWHGDVAVIDKPAGMPVHPCGSYRHNSVSEVLAAQDAQLTQELGVRPLDQATRNR
ncbi:hypothetical protein CYMTET_19370, partial [Cymbomonas tetramitiformis]